MSTPKIIRRIETWRGDTIAIRGVRREIPREVLDALKRVADEKKTTVEQLVESTTNHLTESAATRAIRRLVMPYLPDDWTGEAVG